MTTEQDLLEQYDAADRELTRLRMERAALVEVGATAAVLAAIDSEIAVAEKLWRTAREQAARIAASRRGADA